MRSAQQDLVKFGPPQEWSGSVAAIAGPERRARMKSEWQRMSQAERADIKKKWKRRAFSESLLRSFIMSIVESSRDIEEASGAGAVVGVPSGPWGAPGEGGPGWVEPKGFGMHSSKRKNRHGRKKK